MNFRSFFVRVFSVLSGRILVSFAGGASLLQRFILKRRCIA